MIPNRQGLTVPFAILCIVDLFGVFPIVMLPGPIMKCGWLGIPLAICVFAVQIYTAILLGKCWIIAEEIEPNIIHKNRYPYAAIAELVFGRNVKRIVSVMQDITVFGSTIPNLLIAADNLHTLGMKAPDGIINISFCFWLIIIGLVLCPPIWLGSPKDMKLIGSISVFTVVSVCALTWIIMMQIPNDINYPVAEPSWNTIALAYGVLAFQFDVHPLILTVQMDMKDRRKLPFVLIGAFFITCCLFSITTVIAYLKLGGLVNSNLLDALPESQVLNIDIILVTLQICLSTVVSTTALFQNIEHHLRIPREFTWKRCILRTFVMMLAVLIGEVVPRFDLVMGLIGSLLTGPLMFILPPIFYTKIKSLHYSKIKTSKRVCYRTFPNAKLSLDVGSRRLILASFLVFVGVLATVLSTISNIQDNIINSKLTMSCWMQIFI
ncbi:uncharacterized protein LOC126895557 [Daktulosphaira vitifoliae]|uniref:uncharacterized protein LOC126895557 n=1 Tax=Daktulosphaira vitifoliae TaxID=58002 RepID=UPI0021AA6980|nr:uncharacterized protein LOC126895557 [Daktulosphaira vitifoliae]